MIFFFPTSCPIQSESQLSGFSFHTIIILEYIFIFPQKKKLKQKTTCFSDKNTKSFLEITKTERLLTLCCAIPSNISKFPCINHHKNTGKGTVMRGKSGKEMLPLLMHTKDFQASLKICAHSLHLSFHLSKFKLFLSAQNFRWMN